MTNKQLIIHLQGKVVRDHNKLVQLFKEQRVYCDKQTLEASRILSDVLASAFFKVRTEVLAISLNYGVGTFMNEQLKLEVQ